MQAPTVCPALCKHWPLGSGPGRFDPSPDTPPILSHQPPGPQVAPIQETHRPGLLAQPPRRSLGSPLLAV